jgi:hypothetical protein
MTERTRRFFAFAFLNLLVIALTALLVAYAIGMVRTYG